MNDERTFEELLLAARGLDEEDEAFWDIVWLLSERGDHETFDKAIALTRSEAFERSFAASILGRFGAGIEAPERPFSAEIVDRLLQMLRVEQDENVLSDVVSALGNQVQDPRIPLALQGLNTHPLEALRWNLALTLSHYETPESIKMLLDLTRDSSSDVRDWATFGLGTQCDLDTPAIRAALLERLNDEDEDTRAEAIFGLAKRHDRRVIAAIQRDFDAGFSGALLFQAILETPDASLLASLKAMAQNPNFPPDEDIEAAIAACEA
ncbi:MAG TPA: HEAT repeat domain-containing protein [Abditibacterium sp.]|jgi:HEAT repeat protein